MSRIQTVRICQKGRHLLSATSSGILQNTRPSSSSLFFTPLIFFHQDHIYCDKRRS
uniref:Uncharacterized protein n=1 Tax=Populus trichocarpa TaxID=3694 RepID=A0A3N7GFM2_POPTR